LLGSLVSLGVGILALWLLLGAVRRAKLHYFSIYCWLLGAAVLTGLVWR
jgi:undecaprenyl pyrophosphate phosphatase UppP